MPSAILGWIDQAIDQHKIALSLNPYFAYAHNNLGVAYGKKGFIDKAIKEFQAAVQLNPDNTRYRDNLSKAYEIMNMKGSTGREESRRK